MARSLPGRLEVHALAARDRWQEMAEQVHAFKPKVVALWFEEAADRLSSALKGSGVKVLAGEEGVCEVAAMGENDIVLSAIVGAAGLKPTLAAIRARKPVALANKETIVMAGELVMREADRHGVRILPVDSEHSAIFQAMQSGRHSEIARILITSSGGPLRRMAASDIAHVTPKQALNHPTWQMGPKVTVDSATLMNKALELIEAHYLFAMPVNKIDVVIHPESIVHSLVEFVDGSVAAQLGMPDMRAPIQYALMWPDRVEGPAPKLNLAQVGALHFETPDVERFPAIALGAEAARRGGTAPAALNAANEVAVQAFLDGRLSFPSITRITSEVMHSHRFLEHPALDDVLHADSAARAAAEERVASERKR